MKDRLKIVDLIIIERRNGFECKDANGCGIEPYQLLSPPIASGDLVDPNPRSLTALTGASPLGEASMLFTRHRLRGK